MTKTPGAAKAPTRRGPSNRNSTPQKILSAGLATAACVGVTGVIAVRTVDANVQAAADAATTASAPVDNSAAVSELQAYATQLQDERAKLDAYRAQLIAMANKQNNKAGSQKSATSNAPAQATVVPAVSRTTQAAKPKPKAPATARAPRPAAPPRISVAPAPHANTKSS